MILDERWYDPYKQWLEIGWALHNTDANLLFWTWISFSAKSDKFDFNEIPKMWKCGIVILKMKVLLLELFIIM